MLSFTGATAELAAARDGAPFLVVDIGGGSTEFVLGEACFPGGTIPPRPPPHLGGCPPPQTGPPGPSRSTSGASG